MPASVVTAPPTRSGTAAGCRPSADAGPQQGGTDDDDEPDGDQQTDDYLGGQRLARGGPSWECSAGAATLLAVGVVVVGRQEVAQPLDRLGRSRDQQGHDAHR